MNKQVLFTLSCDHIRETGHALAATECIRIERSIEVFPHTIFRLPRLLLIRLAGTPHAENAFRFVLLLESAYTRIDGILGSGSRRVQPLFEQIISDSNEFLREVVDIFPVLL